MLVFALGLLAGAHDIQVPDVNALLARANRPIATYIAVDRPVRDRRDAPPTRMYALGDPFLVYLNRWGGNFNCGDDNAAANISSIACNAPNGAAQVTGFVGNDAQWNEVKSCVTDLFAPFHLGVTDVEPLAGDYVEAVVGGSPQQAGMEFGVGGVSPYACELIPGGVVYAFSDMYGSDTRGLCETTAQEVAHAFGLDHEFLCSDPLTYLEGCGEKSFQNEWVPCGEFEPRACTCGDASQNSVASMLEMFGASDGTPYVPPVDSGPPSVVLTGPDDGDILPAGELILVTATASDDNALTSVELEWGFSNARLFCPTIADKYKCSKVGDTYVWEIEDTEGSRTFKVIVRDIAGNTTESEEHTIWLSSDGDGPPLDTSPPLIVQGTPLAGAEIPTDVPFVISATITDDNAIAIAEMNWPRRGVDRWVPCPYEDERMSCEKDGSTYKWTVSTGRDGERTFGFRATDILGKTTQTEGTLIEMYEGAPGVPVDNNDTMDDAEVFGCDESRDVSGWSADWFAIDAKVGDTVTIQAAREDAHLIATDGKSIIAKGMGSLSLEIPDGTAIRLAVVPATSSEDEYRVGVTCASPPAAEPAPFGCGQTGGPSSTPPLSALVVGLLAVARRRRPR